ncbi:MAG: hypothetical protein ACLFTT_08955 [Candidatus Hydrogenedentota bacterium]
MALDDDNGLRIYCVCGQKMKVSPAMYGQPGRCVACSQKIRVPSPADLPPGVNVVYLKDYPELLRKPARPTAAVGPDQEAGEVALGDAGGPADIAPLDTLPAVARLCSYEFKVNQALERYRDAAPGSTGAKERTRLMGYRGIARKARAELEEQLRERLAEAAQTLTDIKEQVARAGLSARVGEIDYRQYEAIVRPLRIERERLERLRHNARGWITVEDPYVAGGFFDLALDNPPTKDDAEDVPEPGPAHEVPLLPQLLDGLRGAFALYDDGCQRLAEWEDAQRGTGGIEALRFKAQAQADVERGKAGISFYRERLIQMLKDRDQDIKTLKAQLELARERLVTGVLDHKRHGQIEIDLLRMQNDAIRTRDLARRAINAESLAEVPVPGSTVMRRISRKSDQSAEADAWFAWAAALVLVVAMFLPIVNPSAGGNAFALQGLMIGMVAVALALALAAAIPRRQWRGAVLALLWLVSVAACALYLHEKYFSRGRVGVFMRRDEMWFMQPGMVGIALAAVLLGAAFCVALVRARRMRWVPVAVIGAAALIVSGVATNLGGYLNPHPVIADVTWSPVTKGDRAARDHYRVILTIRNTGVRSCWLNAADTVNPFPVDVLIQRHGATHHIYDNAVRKRYAEGPWLPVTDNMREFRLGPGETMQWEYVLPPGEYQAMLRPAWSHVRLGAPFTLAPPVDEGNASPEGAFTPSPDTDDHTESAEQEGAEQEGAPSPKRPPQEELGVHMRGVGGDPEGVPRFALTLHLPDGRTHKTPVALGDVIYREWVALEYDPRRDALTIGIPSENGIPKDLRIVRTGEQVVLPIEPR